MTSVDSSGLVDCDHFAGDVVLLALDLVGRTLRVRGAMLEDTSVMIVECEAYGAEDDPASHAAFRPGGRAAAMRSTPGTIYVYAAYGMYPCLNIVCGAEGVASAVLVRGVWAPNASCPVLGPGRVSRLLGVTLADHGRTICDDRFAVSSTRQECAIVATPRIGITRGMEAQWRFVTGDRPR